MYTVLKKLGIALGIMLCMSASAWAKHEIKEQVILRKTCKGQPEKQLNPSYRCDCVTESHAIEYDFARRWPEAMGQSLNYAFNENKHAGIVLILEEEDDKRFWLQLNSVVQHFHLPIDTCYIRTYKNEGDGLTLEPEDCFLNTPTSP